MSQYILDSTVCPSTVLLLLLLLSLYYSNYPAVICFLINLLLIVLLLLVSRYLQTIDFFNDIVCMILYMCVSILWIDAPFWSCYVIIYLTISVAIVHTLIYLLIYLPAIKIKFLDGLIHCFCLMCVRFLLAASIILVLCSDCRWMCVNQCPSIAYADADDLVFSTATWLHMQQLIDNLAYRLVW